MANKKNSGRNIEIGEVLLSQDGKTKYIKLTKSLVLEKDIHGNEKPMSVFFEDPKKKYENIVNSQNTTAEQKASAQRRLDNFPEFILYRLQAKVGE